MKFIPRNTGITKTYSVPAEVVSIEGFRKLRKEDEVFERWISFYQGQEHQDLLDALVYEHENDFPLRSSADLLDQLRHRALVAVLQQRAHTEFLKAYLADVSKN